MNTTPPANVGLIGRIGLILRRLMHRPPAKEIAILRRTQTLSKQTHGRDRAELAHYRSVVSGWRAKIERVKQGEGRNSLEGIPSWFLEQEGVIPAARAHVTPHIAGALLLLLLLPSCFVYRGGPSPFLGGIGADIEKATLPDGASFEKVNTSKAFASALKEVKAMWSNYLLARGMEFVAGKYYDQQGLVTNSATTVELEKLRNARTLAEGEQALEALKLTTP